MAQQSQTFSESWYRIAGKRISLRPGVKARRQNYRGERWIVLENPFSNQYFRLRPAAYAFVARLRPDRTVQEAWQECIDHSSDDAPGQESVIQLLSQLYFANLLHYDLAEDSSQLFERYKKRRQREIGSGFMNIMFMRFPLLDPDRFLVRTMPLVGRLFSPMGAVLWLLVVGFALKVAVDNFSALSVQTQSVLAPNNLFLLYIGLIFIKTIHEFGHAYCCRKFGGEVHVMGLMLMIFTPIPYVDASSSWGFRSRWKRVLVGASGMIAEIFIAALAAFVWVNTGEGTLHSLAYNIMFIASISTVIFNINPLLRYDGYYILSDFVEIPNLQQRASSQLRHLGERYLFGLTDSEGPATTRRGAVWLAVFGVTAAIYRVLVFSGVLLAISDKFLIIGMVMALVCLISWVTVPIFRFLQYLATSPRLERQRTRAVGVSAGLILVLLLALEVIPFPSHFRASGVIRAAERSQLANQTAGYLEEILVKNSGDRVVRGQALLRLNNRELELNLEQTQARFNEVEAHLLKAMKDETADLAPLMKSREAIVERLQKLKADTENLVIRAPHDGLWFSPDIGDCIGRWVPRGSNVGLLMNPKAFEFSATVMQEDGDALFGRELRGAQVVLLGQAATKLPVRQWRVVPGEQRFLPSAALGWKAGGDVPVEQGDTRGNKAAEPFFEVICELAVPPGVVLMDGCSGKIRFDLRPEPLLPRWLRRLRQLLQKRYQL